MKQLILIGGFHETIELCRRAGWEILGIVDNAISGELCGAPVLGTDAERGRIRATHPGVPMVVTPDAPTLRMKLARLYEVDGWQAATVLSPRAMISVSASIGAGTVVQDAANLSAGVRLGPHVRVNTYANLMHDASVGAFTTIAPNAVLLGKVEVGERVYVGACAVLLPGIRVGSGAVVGAGAVVTKDVPEGITVAGNPARELRRNA
jgi:sugar O-acyltransferase (sialic acid O-acetyltransferase NeuD family)